MRHHRPSKADGLLIGALLGVLAGGLIVMQCGRPEPTPPPATVTATPLSTVVVVGPTQTPATSTPTATVGHLPLGGSGGLLNR